MGVPEAVNVPEMPVVVVGIMTVSDVAPAKAPETMPDEGTRTTPGSDPK
jgi:hypothetical protein